MKTSVIGAGAFGFSIAHRLSTSESNEVTVWSESQEKIDEYLETGRISRVLGGHVLPENIRMTGSMEEAVKGQDLVMVLTTAAYVQSVCRLMVPYVSEETVVVVGAKGACPDGSLPANAAIEILGRDVSAIAGPGFAIDIIEDVPVGFTFATHEDFDYQSANRAFAHDNHLMLDKSYDITGVELCSCIKNAAALACGSLYGAGHPISTQCLMMQRVLSDISRMLANIEGGSRETPMSLAGVGDMILTCFSPKSRNGSFGRIVGEFGYDSDEARDYLEQNTVEGLSVVKRWGAMSRKLGVTSRFMDVLGRVFSDDGDISQLIGYISE